MTWSFSAFCSIHKCTEFWGGHLGGVAGTLGFPLERRVSLMLITMLIAAVGANRTLLQLRLWAFALAFRREVLACLDVSFTAAASLLPRRRCQVNGQASCCRQTWVQSPVKGSSLQTLRRMALADAPRPLQRRLCHHVRCSRGEGRTREVRLERCRTPYQYARCLRSRSPPLR